MVTKKDLNGGLTGLRSEMVSEFSNVRREMASEFSNVRLEMLNLEHRLVIKLGGLMATLMTLGLTATQLLG